MIKIEKKIVGYDVAKPTVDEAAEKPEFKREGGSGSRAEVIRMHEKLERPEMLIGSTYKVKTPVSDHAMYVTINDIVLNEGTEYEKRRPFEIGRICSTGPPANSLPTWWIWRKPRR